MRRSEPPFADEPERQRWLLDRFVWRLRRLLVFVAVVLGLGQVLDWLGLVPPL